MSFFNRFRQKFSREAEAGHPPLDPGEPAQDEASAPALTPETHDITPDEVIGGILRTIETSTLFDPRHYGVQARDGGFTLEGDPLLHYVEIGEAAGLSPNPLFYPGYYASEISLDHRPACFLDHYCRVGWQQGLRTSPLFDGAYYTRNNPDIAAAQVIPLLHFLTTGGWEGRRPHPLFQTLEYAQAIPGLAESGENPLVYYLRQGPEHRVSPHPVFDPQYYLQTNADVAQAGWNPLLHFVWIGVAEGRQPNAQFSPALFRRSNADPLRLSDDLALLAACSGQ